MKKLLSFLLITVVTTYGTLLPVQETKWQKCKRGITSKPAILLYGMLAAGGLVWFLKDNSQNTNGKDVRDEGKNNIQDTLKKDIEFGKVVNEAIHYTYKGNIGDYIKAITKHPFIKVTDDGYRNGQYQPPTTYTFFISEAGNYQDLNGAAAALWQTKSYIESYNKYQNSKALPTLQFDVKYRDNAYLYPNEWKLKQLIITL